MEARNKLPIVQSEGNIWHSRVRRITAWCAATTALTPFFTNQTYAAPADFEAIGTGNVLVYAAFLATFAFSVASTFVFMRSRNTMQRERDKLAEQLADIRAHSERYETLMQADDQRLIIWAHKSTKASVVGNLPEKCDAPSDEQEFLAFGKWLSPASAAGLERHIDDLRSNGTSFQLAISTTSGKYLDAYGRTVGARVFVRFRDLSGDQQVQMELQRKLDNKSDDVRDYQALLEQMRQPVWLRRRDEEETSHVKWANKAYRDAVGVDGDDANLPEMLDSDARASIAKANRLGEVFTERVNAVSGGDRLTFDIVSVPTGKGSAGIATDVTDAKRAEAALNRTIASHEKTLNELATPITIFDKQHRLTFYNKAYRDLFDLPDSFLRSCPTDSEVLDKLRTLEKVPVEANFRQWKNNILNVQQSVEMQEFTWHLPDGQTLRVVASPHLSGGVTWIYENLTAQLNLESRVNVLSRLQDETLNRLSDGVAVFSSDGQLTLSNQSFGALWSLDDETRGSQLHINEIAQVCMDKQGCDDDWHNLKMAVVGVSEKRDEANGEMYRPDGSVLRYSTNALIDGRTMMTFVDVTDSINFERALTEKNEALKEADKLKNDFVQHMSYELRSPLTNIIGFAQLLSDADMGPLTDKQQEYTNYILSSSSSVLAIINDILDLATADAGVLELSLSEVDVRTTVESAVEGLKDRLMDRGIELHQNVQEDVEALICDERRMVQILFNLLSNAIQFSTDNSKIALSITQDDEMIRFQVQDWGTGIPDAFLEQVFNRFESRNAGPVRGGVGLGLSIVKRFVELHGGDVQIESRQGVGTTVICSIPREPVIESEAAE